MYVCVCVSVCIQCMCSLLPNYFVIVIPLHYYSYLDLSQEEQLDPHIIIKMGIFSPHGVSETSQDTTEELNGAPIGSLGPRIQYMVR